jgi:hypothetical protein
MNVYVESNFVLEHALEQEECDSCSEIIQLASQGRITLLIPAFSLAEPHQAIAGKAKARSRLSAELSAQLGELGRSKPHRSMPSTFGVLAAALAERVQFEREGMRRTITELIRTAEIIPLDSATLHSAIRIEDEYADGPRCDRARALGDYKPQRKLLFKPQQQGLLRSGHP